MHLFGGNGRHGRHGASGHDSDGYDYEYGEDYGEDEEEEEACYDDGAHYDDDYDYDRRYYERMERYERRSQYARRGEYRPYEDYDPDYGRYGERRFASDDIVSREELRARRPRWPRRLLAAFLTLVVLAGGLFAAYRVWAQRPDQQQGGLNDYSDPEPAESGVGAVEPQSDANKRDGVWTFFIAGIDVVGNHNDTNMVGMFDTVNGKLNIVNLPRDMLVNVNLNIKKINQPYAADINNGGDGIDPLLECISDILGYSVDMYALIDISAAAEIVDAIGGVYFDIPYDMDWDAPDQDPPLHIQLVLFMDQGCCNCRDLILAVVHRASEGLRFNGEIHQAERCPCVKTVRHSFHALSLQMPVAHHLLHCVSRDLHSREGKDRHCLFDR